MLKRLTSYIKNKKGLSLVETLTAFSILALILFCMAPLYLSYFQSINIAGQKIEETYDEAGLMQTLIGNKGKNLVGRYESNVSEIPMVFNVPQSSVTRDGYTTTIPGVTINVRAASEAANSDTIDPIKGNFISTDPNDIANGFVTVYTDSVNSNIKCFPSTLTDDFKTAYISLVADGFSFADNDLSGSKYALYVTKANASGTGSSLQKLTYGKDYVMEKVKNSNDQIILVTLYGGSEISFENSPLVFNYNYGAYTKEIEIDAPSMIMVGEAATDGNYYYYVSRGNVDEDGNLEVIRRTMNSKDPKATGATTLTVGMNDVEWVPAESADQYAVDGNGDKYGYYVMCGDNGQIRRFWRNNTTGNYYWGGDYTYYSDFNFDHINEGANFIRSTDTAGTVTNAPTYSTDVSFKFISQRNMENTQAGFNLASREYTVAGLINTSTGLLRGLTVVTVTNSDDAEFFATDGLIYYYQSKKDDNSGAGNANLPTYSQIISYVNGSTHNGNEIQVNDGITMTTHNAYGWLTSNTSSYYEAMGVDQNSVNNRSYPITLTSVDAMQLTGSGSAYYSDVKADGSYYFTAEGDGDTSAENATTSLNYPTSSYTLYCGYIPAVMDLWITGTGGADYSDEYTTLDWVDAYAKTGDGTFFEINDYSHIGRASNRKTLANLQTYYGLWRATLGVTPYLNVSSDTAPKVNETIGGWHAYYKKNSTAWLVGWKYPYEHIMFYPYTNLEYAITGKFYDRATFASRKDDIMSMFGNKYNLVDPWMIISNYKGIQQNVTNGDIVDVTVGYLSHPFAISVSANPTDDIVYDLSNKKDDARQVYYWNNRRETITFLDSASTVVPNGELDIPVSLMVGYVMGGTAEFAEKANNFYANVGSVMNNGIVFLRAGTHETGKQNSANGQTYEYYAKDKTGYKLDAESNIFHQFYYLNSRAYKSTVAGYSDETWDEPSKGKHIGNLYGADFWQNNRHIQYKGLTGRNAVAVPGQDNSSNYEYLRCHPLTNTQVNCVAWGSTWGSDPEAMWGTENGTLLSWYVDLDATTLDSDSSYWNDRSVDAEFQSYQWVDNCSGQTFGLVSDAYKDTLGSAVWGTGTTTQSTFYPGSEAFKGFYDKTTQRKKQVATLGFISVLDTINDVAYDNDIWVAVGDQSDKEPVDYCPQGAMTYGSYSLGTQQTVKAFTGNGNGGSWVNVRYWVDTGMVGHPTEANSDYYWKAVKISDNEHYNIQQINNVNGLWIATGYEDVNDNNEYDDGEKTVVCWARNPLIACDDSTQTGGWSDATVIWALQDGKFVNVTDEMGGINSVATRTME